MSQITWRNINAPSNNGAAQLMRDASDSFTNAFDGIGGIIKAEQGIRRANHENTGVNNTQAIRDGLAGFKTVDEFNAARQSGAIDRLRGEFKNYDKAAISAAIESRPRELMQEQNAADTYNQGQVTKQLAPLMDAYTMAMQEGRVADGEAILNGNRELFTQGNRLAEAGNIAKTQMTAQQSEQAARLADEYKYLMSSGRTTEADALLQDNQGLFTDTNQMSSLWDYGNTAKTSEREKLANKTREEHDMLVAANNDPGALALREQHGSLWGEFGLGASAVTLQNQTDEFEYTRDRNRTADTKQDNAEQQILDLNTLVNTASTEQAAQEDDRVSRITAAFADSDLPMQENGVPDWDRAIAETPDAFARFIEEKGNEIQSVNPMVTGSINDFRAQVREKFPDLAPAELDRRAKELMEQVQAQSGVAPQDLAFLETRRISIAEDKGVSRNPLFLNRDVSPDDAAVDAVNNVNDQLEDGERLPTSAMPTIRKALEVGIKNVEGATIKFTQADIEAALLQSGPRGFWGDAGKVEGILRDYANSTTMVERQLAYDEYDKEFKAAQSELLASAGLVSQSAALTSEFRAAASKFYTEQAKKNDPEAQAAEAAERVAVANAESVEADELTTAQMNTIKEASTRSRRTGELVGEDLRWVMNNANQLIQVPGNMVWGAGAELYRLLQGPVEGVGDFVDGVIEGAR